MTKRMVRVKLDTYPVVSRAVEEGVAFGIQRAHKHTDRPDETALKENVYREVMNALCEVIRFD